MPDAPLTDANVAIDQSAADAAVGADVTVSDAEHDAADGSDAADTSPPVDGGVKTDAPDAPLDDGVVPADAGDAAADASDATAEAGDAAEDTGLDAGGDAADGSPAADAGAACLGNTTIDLTALAPYWLNASTACGTATVSGEGLTLTRTSGCSADQQGGWVKLDGSKWRLCGDFDVRVDFNLTTFPVPPGGSRWAALRAFDPASSSGISLERYNDNLGGCYPASNNYKSWTTSSTDCASSIFRATTDASGTFRVTRSGSTVTSYTWAGVDAGADGSGWSAFDMGTGMTTVPWSIEFYTGVYNGDTTTQKVTFSNLVITSASTP
jgi:hypothetical protein